MIRIAEPKGPEAVIEKISALCQIIHNTIAQFDAASPEAQDECRDEALCILTSALEVLDESRDALPTLVGEEMAREIQKIMKTTHNYRQ